MIHLSPDKLGTAHAQTGPTNPVFELKIVWLGLAFLLNAGAGLGLLWVLLGDQSPRTSALTWTSGAIWFAVSAVTLGLCYRLYQASRDSAQTLLRFQSLAERFELATRAASIGVWDWNITTDQWFASSTYHTMLGYPPEDGPDDRAQWSSRVHPEDRERLAAHIQRVLSNCADNYEYEVRLMHADGHYRWIHVVGRVLERNGEGRPTRIMGVRMDITERKAQQSMLKLAEQVFAQGIEGILVTDASGRVVLVNQAFSEISGYAREEVIGQMSRILASDRYDDAFHDKVSAAVRQHGFWQGEVWSQRKNGADYPQWLRISVVRDQEGHICNLVGTFSDITEKKASQEKINWLSHFDPATGLPNRYLLQDRASQAISMAHHAQQTLILLFITLEEFDSIHDARGYAGSDRALKEAGQRLGRSLDDQGILAHLGNKEFVMVLPGTSPEAAAEQVMTLQARLSEPFDLDGETMALTATVGVATYPENGDDFPALMGAAEIAMHRAQENRRGSFAFYSEDVHQQVLARAQIAKALRKAIDHRELTLEYQPLADLQTGHTSGVEALLRWDHPELGRMVAADFIPLAEQTGLIRSIGDWVLRHACEDIRRWQSAGLVVPPVAVNVSSKQFSENDFLGQVQRALADYGIAPSSLYLEVTESALIMDVARSETLLRQLKEEGIRLSLDDFGTGYSSLSYLKRYPFDKVKIDHSFVRDITADSVDSTDATLVEAIVSMAHGLGLQVVAEGVETEAQCEAMRSSVCDEIQGHFFSKPVPASEMESLLSAPPKLPESLLRFRKPQRTLLLVDDESNVLASLKRLFRGEGHQILTANGGQEGLDVLSRHKVDVIVSDQRMPGMTGVEFLRAAKVAYPQTIRIVLSGYTELQSITDAINEGAIYRFLTKPWEDDLLRDHIRKAFEYKELLDDNQQLEMTIRTKNQELVAANVRLQHLLENTRHQVEREVSTLSVVRDALECIPIPVIGIAEDGLIAFVNACADALLDTPSGLLGEDLASTLPFVHAAVYSSAADQSLSLIHI